MFATLNTANTANTADNGLSFEVRELEYKDDCVPTPGPGPRGCGSGYIEGLECNEDSPLSDSPTSPSPLVRSTSSSITSPTAAALDDNYSNSSKPSIQCSPAMATADVMF